MEDKETYTLQELFEDLPISLIDLGKKAGINEVTIARIRDGKPTRRSTANRLLLAFSSVYGKTLNVRNVTGINLMENKRLEKKEQKKITKPAA